MKNKLFKKGLAMLVAACTLISSAGFGGITAKADGVINYTLGKEVSGTVTEDVKYVYKFTTPNEDAYYKLSLKGVEGEGYVTTRLFRDAELCDYVDSSYMCEWAGQYEVKDLEKWLAPNKTYYLVADSESSNTLEYRMKLEKYDVDDHPDSRTSLTEIKVGKETTGMLNHSTDYDFYTFVTDNTDSFYNLSLKSIGSAEDNGYTKLLIFKDPEMTEMPDPYNDFAYAYSGSLTNVELHKHLEPNKRYYIRIEGQTDKFTNIKYTFKITSTKDDVADKGSSAKKMELNKSYKQKIEDKEDVDFFKVTADVYTDYTVVFKNATKDKVVLLEVFKDPDAIERVEGAYYRIYSTSSVGGADAKLKLIPGKTYYFRVTGDGDFGTTYTVGLNATSPDGTKVKKTKSKVTISWKKLAKAKGYEVHRATGTSNTFKCIKTIKSAKTVKYVDKTVKKGKTYKYKVRAYATKNGKKVYSSFSPVKTIKVK